MFPSCVWLFNSFSNLAIVTHVLLVFQDFSPGSTPPDAMKGNSSEKDLPPVSSDETSASVKPVSPPFPGQFLYVYSEAVGIKEERCKIRWTRRVRYEKDLNLRCALICWTAMNPMKHNVQEHYLQIPTDTHACMKIIQERSFKPISSYFDMFPIFYGFCFNFYSHIFILFWLLYISILCPF